jgi:hypothetical protein
MTVLSRRPVPSALRLLVDAMAKAAIPAREIRMAAIANKRNAQAARTNSSRCWTLVGTAEKGAVFARMDSLIFASFFLFSLLRRFHVLFFFLPCKNNKKIA